MSVGSRIILLGAICTGLAVAIGAFGAHALEGRVSAEMLANYETGARYHFYHSLGILAVGMLALIRAGRATARVAADPKDPAADPRDPAADPKNPAAEPEAAAADPVLTRLRWSAVLMLTGIVLFSGSLYTMALTGETWLGAVTPFGGVAFLAAWGLLAWAAGAGE
ncbi:MAG: DUF423 domain-containing protein [Acidobacteria bacterium]|nr:DUF423 domain-containing protein [Acidobacteriota bacterium]